MIPRRLSSAGQIVIEYMLLLVIVVALGAFLVKGLIDRSEGDEGIVVKKWQEVQKEIGKDLPDQCVSGEGSSTANCNQPH